MVPTIMETGVDPLVSNLRAAALAGRPVDLFQQLHFLAWDVIGQLTFGRSFGMLQTSANHPAVGWVSSVLRFGAVCYGFPLLARFRIPDGERLRGFTWGIMEAYYAEHRPGDTGLLSSFIDAVDDVTGDSLSKADIFGEAHIILQAGTDTTSNTLALLIHQLLTHPACYARLREELDRAGDGNDYQALPYLEASIKETLRLFPSIPNVIFRDVPKAGHQLLGHQLPPGTEIGVCVYSLHRSPQHWVRPDEFLPDRFLSDSISTHHKPDLRCYMPFSLGPRSCIGKE